MVGASHFPQILFQLFWCLSLWHHTSITHTCRRTRHKKCNFRSEKPETVFHNWLVRSNFNKYIFFKSKSDSTNNINSSISDNELNLNMSKRHDYSHSFILPFNWDTLYFSKGKVYLTALQKPCNWSQVRAKIRLLWWDYTCR